MAIEFSRCTFILNTCSNFCYCSSIFFILVAYLSFSYSSRALSFTSSLISSFDSKKVMKNSMYSLRYSKYIALISTVSSWSTNSDLSFFKPLIFWLPINRVTSVWGYSLSCFHKILCSFVIILEKFFDSNFST
jgi:hypothetical protein